MGTGSSSKNDDEDVRNRLNSGDFQKVSPPSSPNIIVAPSIVGAPTDEMSYSGILVENPGTDAPRAASPIASSAMSASFAADLSTPPVSNRSKSRTKAAAASKEEPRRIVKATPPPSSDAIVDMDDHRNDNEPDSPSVHHHATALASPIGANSATEMLEESIEKNASKNKQRVTNKQKSDREKLLQEKRRRQQPSNDNKPKVQANPFSRFLSAFSLDTNPTHKRKESSDGGDPNKRLKFGYDDSTETAGNPAADSPKAQNEDSSSEAEAEDTRPGFLEQPWVAAASVATLAVLVFAVLRGTKKK